MSKETEEELLKLKRDVLKQAQWQVEYHTRNMEHYKSLLNHAENTLDKSLLQVLWEGVK